MRKSTKRPAPAEGNCYRMVSNGHIVSISLIHDGRATCIDSGYNGNGPLESVEWSLALFNLQYCGTFEYIGTI